MRHVAALVFAAVLLCAGSAHACQLWPLDTSAVATGGVAVTALNQGHRLGCVNQIGGGWLFNPATSTINLCINEVATASGTTSQGSLTCIVPGQSYTITAGAGPVSVVSSDSSHAFSGYGQAP